MTRRLCLPGCFGAGLVLAGLLWPAALSAQDLPEPPCDAPPRPSYSDPDLPPNLQVWNGTASDAAWVPPACMGWKEAGFRMLVALSASFPFDGDGEDMLARFGAVSTFRGIRYWSASAKDWRVLITDAAALEGPSVERRRPDFTVAEMKIGNVLYFMQDDNGSSGPIVYRLQVLEVHPARLVVEFENVSPIRRFLFTLFHPGDLQFVYFLEARLPGLWGLYSLLRTGRGASLLSSGHRDSYVSSRGRFLSPYRRHPDQSEPAAGRSAEGLRLDGEIGGLLRADQVLDCDAVTDAIGYARPERTRVPPGAPRWTRRR